MRIRKLGRTAAALALGVVAAAVPAGAAQAYSGPHYWMYTDDGNPGGRVDFWPYGDIVKVCDIQADGAHVHVVLHDIETYKGYDVVASGNGNCTTRRANMGAAYDLPERGRNSGCIWFDIRLWDDHVSIPNSTDTAAWWNDNDTKDNC